MTAADVTVVIVNFNTCDALEKCLRALDREGAAKIVVVDNGSSDRSVAMVKERFPAADLVEADENLGFSRGNNVGAARADTALTLFLNSDAYASPASLDRLATVFDDPAVVAAGGRLFNPDGTLQESVAGPLTLGAVFLEQTLLEKVFRGYWQTRSLPQDRPGSVTQVMGACLMVRTRIEPWDERFFLYCEDTDLCLRLKRRGTILYVPDAVFTHDLGTSSRRSPWLGIARYNAGKELFFRLHHGVLQSYACFLFDRMGALLRIFAKPRQASTFWRVLTARRSALRPTR